MSKKKILLGVLGAFTAGVLAFLGYVSTRPSSYTVSRSLVVGAPPEAVGPYLTDLRQWITWNPWDELEPTSTKVYSDPASGVGAWYTWSGEEVGAGRMEITGISPTRVDYALTFTAPMEDQATVHMELAPEGAGHTRVTWSMEGELDFMGKVMDTLMGMEDMIAPDFERGLASLNERVSAAPAPAAP